MKVIVYNDRDLNVIEEYSTQNENDFEVMEFKFSSLFDNYNKKIVFLTPDGNISYYINNNIFSIPREITQYEQVKFYIWCTFENKDFRTKLKILSFYKNENVNIDILPLEKAQIEQIINELEKNILIVQNLEKQTTDLIDEIETKLNNGDFVGPQGPPGPPGPQGEPGESYDDTEIKEEISDIKEEQTTQNTRIEELEEQVQELESNQLTGTATGQSIYIEDSTNAKVRDIGLSGNSEQDGEPTPENPVEIHSTGDSGSVNEKVQKVFSFVQGGIGDTTGVDNTVTTRIKTDFIEVTENTSIIYNCYSDESVKLRGVHYYNKDKTWLSYSGQSDGYDFPNTKITPVNCKYIKAVVQKSTNTENITPNNKYLRLSISPEQTLSFPLSQGQKLMQGDYLADDGIHHKMNEIALTGTENIRLDSSYNKFDFTISNLNMKTFGNIMSNYFLNSSGGELYIQGANTKTQFWLFDKNHHFNEDVAELKSWLAEQYTNGTPVKVQYELATEVIEPYTEEQQAVWEQIKALRTYKPVTHISSEDEVPATVNVTYVKDLETVINNLGGA